MVLLLCCCWFNRAPCVWRPLPLCLIRLLPPSLEIYGLYYYYYTLSYFFFFFLFFRPKCWWFFFSVLCVVTIFEMEMIFRPQHFPRNETRLVYIVYFELRLYFPCVMIFYSLLFFLFISSPFRLPDFSFFFFLNPFDHSLFIPQTK